MVNSRFLLKTILFFTVLTGIGFMRLDIDTNVINSLPNDQKVISDALDIFTNHPIHDQIVVDITLDHDDINTLIKCSDFVEKKFSESGLFAEVGMAKIGGLLPELAIHAAQNLPFLFSARELREQVLPRLSPSEIIKQVNKIYADLSGMDGIGQADFITHDPLGLKNLVMAKMAALAPTGKAHIYQGKLISSDGRHLLVTARPSHPGTDTASARKISSLIANIANQLRQNYAPKGYKVTITATGAYRAALDNELIIRKDVNIATTLAILGIAILLLIAFPRPLIGLLSLVPALAGTAAALFVFSLFHSDIAIMVLGFGGAIISITVDHGIAYLLFFECQDGEGATASHELWAVGLMAAVTTISAFLVLCFSGFPIFVELGQFTAMGVLFSFLFVHYIFPKIFTKSPPHHNRVLPLQKIVDKLFNTGRTGAVIALIFVLFLLFYAKPVFNTNLNAMNTVSRDTQAADVMFAKVWGDISSKSYLMVSGESIDKISEIDDLLLGDIEHDVAANIFASAFVPAMIFPGEKRRKENFASWQKFWNSKRTKEVKNSLLTASKSYGFAVNAFEPFFNEITASKNNPKVYVPSNIPASFYELLGISEAKGRAGLVQFITFTPGKSYNAHAFLQKYGVYGKIYAPKFFAEKLGDLLFSTFSRMFVIIALSVTMLLFLAFLSWRLTLITLIPVIFAYISTLGTLKLLGHPLDIPGLMLSIIILGMGIDYSIFFVRAHQRYRRVDHPSYKIVRMAVFMAAVSTLIGFGTLITAEHSLLNSAGLTSLLGIGYSLIGAFVLLPPLLKVYFARDDLQSDKDINDRILRRYRLVEAYPKMFARFKLKFDPMFTELPAIFANYGQIRTIIDIGCGYGVPTAWCLEYFKDAQIYAIDPNPERVRIASLVIQGRGEITRGWAPEMPVVHGVVKVDALLMLDMLHYLDDEAITDLFNNSGQMLKEGGVLIARYVIIPEARPSWLWYLEDSRIKFAKMTPHYRTIQEINTLLVEAGFVIDNHNLTASNDELVWLVARNEKR